LRYFSYNTLKDDEHLIETMTEDEIRKIYYPWWYERMCNKFGKDVVDSTYNFEDCLEDWKIVNWAWEVKN
jgi:hypothetical protein